MAAPIRNLVLTLGSRKCYILPHIRRYSIKPPPSLEKIIRYGALRPDQDDVILPSLEQRLQASTLNGETEELKAVDIGVKHEVPSSIKKEQLQRWRKKRQEPGSELEQASRLQKLKVPLDEVNDLWMQENGPKHVKKLAEHYGIYKDLFNGGFFLPVVPLDINYEYEGEFVNPVYRGNRISPFEANKQPEVSFDAAEGSLWTLILTNPDGHLQDNESEYLHWLIGNIPAGDISKGEVLCDYLQPFPPRGTGFHRMVFVLMEQEGRLDFSDQQRSPQCHSLEERTFKTADFLSQHEDRLTPKGLAFFQSEYDDSVRDIFYKTLDMREPSFEYAHPPFYHPPQEAYPYKQPFDRYFDRYRDKKDLAEEVIKIKMSMISPFTSYERPKFPLIHRSMKGQRPTWLNKREDKMHRRLEQFKDLP